MGYVRWLLQNWMVLVQTAALVSIAGTLILDARVRRVANFIRLTEQHRDLWDRVHSRPQLSRVLDPRADLTLWPVTVEEELFVIALILHLSSSFYAFRTGVFWKPQGLARDIRRFFTLPVPRAVWEKVRALQDEVFARFVDGCLPTDGEPL